MTKRPDRPQLFDVEAWRAAGNKGPLPMDAAPPVAVPKPKPPSKEVQLSMLPEDVHPTPNAILRSALFGMVRKGRRRFFQEAVEVASWKGTSITYQGAQLDQADLTVFMKLVKLANDRVFAEGQTLVEYEEKPFLRSIRKNTGRGASAADVDWLRTSIGRMRFCDVQIEDANHYYSGGLIERRYGDKKGERRAVALNNDLARLLRPDGFTGLSMEIRLELQGHLAQWMAGFVCTHASPKPMRLSTIHPLTGSLLEPRDLATRLRKNVFPQLKSLGVISSWKISPVRKGRRVADYIVQWTRPKSLP